MHSVCEHNRVQTDDYKFVTKIVNSPDVVVVVDDDGVGLNVADDDDICGVRVCWFVVWTIDGCWICCKLELIICVDKLWFWWLIRVIGSKLITVVAVVILLSLSLIDGFTCINDWDLDDEISAEGIRSSWFVSSIKLVNKVESNE